MISTAGTVCSAAEMARENGAKIISVFATHGLFTGIAYDRLINSCIDNIYVTDTVPISEKIINMKKPRIYIISVANLLGEAIMRIYKNKSVSALLNSNYEINM
jgi:ribose-phosphate pyrophosphokinase